MLFRNSVRIIMVVIVLNGFVCHADQGPLQMTNRFPLHLLFLTPRPVAPEIPHAGHGEVAMAVEYSSIFFDHRNRLWDFLLDMEVTTLDLSVEFAAAPHLALRLDAPVVMMNDGFLDDFLGNYHDTLGVPNYGREERPADSFAYQVSKDGRVWLNGRSSPLMPADATLSLEWEIQPLVAKRGMATTLIASMKLPVGDSDKGLGSGAWDYGIYWSAAWHADKWSFYAMPGFAWIGEPETRGADISTRNSPSLFLGAVYHSSPQCHWMAQLNGYTSPVESTGISALDNGSLELDLGFHYRINDPWTFVFGFGEDLTRAVPDFSVHMGLIWKWRL